MQTAGVELFHSDGRTCGRTDVYGEADSHFSQNAPKVICSF